jgi:hypothetical protein
LDEKSNLEHNLHSFPFLVEIPSLKFLALNLATTGFNPIDPLFEWLYNLRLIEEHPERYPASGEIPEKSFHPLWTFAKIVVEIIACEN